MRPRATTRVAGCSTAFSYNGAFALSLAHALH